MAATQAATCRDRHVLLARPPLHCTQCRSRSEAAARAGGGRTCRYSSLLHRTTQRLDTGL